MMRIRPTTHLPVCVWFDAFAVLYLAIHNDTVGMEVKSMFLLFLTYIS